MTQLSPANLDKAFALLVECAVKGERCPVTSGPSAVSGLHSHHFPALAHEGRIAIEISNGNFRRVTILTGPHAGKKTAANPDPKARVFQTVDASGRRINGKLTDPGAGGRKQPSAPRPLTSAELFR